MVLLVDFVMVYVFLCETNRSAIRMDYAVFDRRARALAPNLLAALTTLPSVVTGAVAGGFGVSPHEGCSWTGPAVTPPPRALRPLIADLSCSGVRCGSRSGMPWVLPIARYTALASSRVTLPANQASSKPWVMMSP